MAVETAGQEWLAGDLENFIEAAAFLAMSWDLCDDQSFQAHCRQAFGDKQTPDQAAASWWRKRTDSIEG